MNENAIDDIIEEVKSNICSILREERIVNGIAKTGTICGILSLIIIVISVSCYFLMIFPLIVQYGPGVTMALGTVSTYATFYGWYRILRRKNKANLKEEGKGEAQNQIIAFIKSLPDMFRKVPGSLVSTLALAASVATGAAIYTPFGEKAEKAARTTIAELKPLAAELRAELKPLVAELIAVGTSKEVVEEIATEKVAQEIEIAQDVKTYNISGKLNLSGAGSKERAIVELLHNETIEKWVFADKDGNYLFMNVPVGNYTMKIKLSGYKNLSSYPFALNNNTHIPELIMLEEFPKPKPAIAAKLKPKPQSNSVAIAPLPPPPQPPLLPVVMPATATASVLVAPADTPVNTQVGTSVNTPVRTSMHTPQKASSSDKSGFFVGLGSEVNNNAKKGNAIGSNMALGYDMNKHFAFGINAVYSNDLEEEETLESKLMLRYYLPVGGPFMQAEAGGALNKNDKNNIVPQGGMAAGWRFSVDKEWFVEPAVRGGYPYVWGTGITLGKKFGH